MHALRVPRALSQLGTGTHRLRHMLMAASCTELGALLETAPAAPARRRRRWRTWAHPERPPHSRHGYSLASCAGTAALRTPQLPWRGQPPHRASLRPLMPRTRPSPLASGAPPLGLGKSSRRGLPHKPKHLGREVCSKSELNARHIRPKSRSGSSGTGGGLAALAGVEAGGAARSSSPLLGKESLFTPLGFWGPAFQELSYFSVAHRTEPHPTF